MEVDKQIRKLSKPEQRIATRSYHDFERILQQIQSDEVEIEIEAAKRKISVPLKALYHLSDVLKIMSQGKTASIVPMATHITTQQSAELLNCSRPHLVKLLEQGKIPYTQTGKHRRVKIDDLLRYKDQIKSQQKQHLIDIMRFDEAAGLYD